MWVALGRSGYWIHGSQVSALLTPVSLIPVGKRLLRVRISGELWRAVHIEALNKGVTVGSIIEDAIALYLALSQGNVSLVLKQGATLNLTTIKPSTATPCEQASKPTVEPEAKPVVTPQPAIVVDADAPSFVRDNPWLAIISRRGS
jgi:hypothetical protein